MNSRPPDRRRTIPVRLPDVPLERRLKAATVACREEDEEYARIEIALAARYPSDRTYWVAA